MMVRKMNLSPPLLAIWLGMSTFGGFQVIKKPPLQFQFYKHNNCIEMGWNIL